MAPQGHWAAGTYHTVTVDAGALAASGAPMATPARAAFLTRDAAAATIAATVPAGKRIGVGSAFTIDFDRAIDAATVEAAFSIVPATPGTLAPTDHHGDAVRRSRARPRPPPRPGRSPRTRRCVPNTTYRVTLDGVLDTDGIPVPAATLAVRTGVSPGVVRFRPRADTKAVERGAAISVRFTQPMDEASTKKAFAVVAGTAPVAGKVSFAEDDTVLVFQPAKALPYGAEGRDHGRDHGPQPRRRPARRGREGRLPDGPEAGPGQARRREDAHRRQHRRRRRRRRAAEAAVRSAVARGRRSRRTTSA